MEACNSTALFNTEVAALCYKGLLSSGLPLVQMVPMCIPFLLLLLLIRLWRFYGDSRDPSSSLPLPPGTMGWPIIGETLSLMSKGSEFFKEKTACYGRIYKTHILGNRTIRVTGAANVAKILQGEGTLVTSKWPISTRLILGEGALAHSTGTVHKWRREMIMRAFSPQAITSYLPTVQTMVRDHIQNWCKSGHIHGYPEARSLTFTIAAKLLLGIAVEEKKKYKMLILFEDMLATLFSMPLPIPGIGLYRGMKARKQIMQEIASCIEQRRSGKGQKKDDALELILKASEDGSGKLSSSEVQDSALEMLFAGHLPTSSAASSVLMHLGANPQVVDKLSVELYDAGLLDIKDHPDLTLNALHSLPYLNSVVREVLRLAPPVGAGYRKVLQTFEIDGCQVPKGWTVVYSIRETHHTSELYKDGAKFNPDRWLQSNGNPHEIIQTADENFHYAPFGFGERSCVGQKFVDAFLKILIVELVRNASWRLINGMPEILYMPVPHPKDNLPIQMKTMPPDLRRRAFTNSW